MAGSTSGVAKASTCTDSILRTALHPGRSFMLAILEGHRAHPLPSVATVIEYLRGMGLPSCGSKSFV